MKWVVINVVWDFVFENSENKIDVFLDSVKDFVGKIFSLGDIE